MKEIACPERIEFSDAVAKAVIAVYSTKREQADAVKDKRALSLLACCLRKPEKLS